MTNRKVFRKGLFDDGAVSGHFEFMASRILTLITSCTKLYASGSGENCLSFHRLRLFMRWNATAKPETKFM